MRSASPASAKDRYGVQVPGQLMKPSVLVMVPWPLIETVSGVTVLGEGRRLTDSFPVMVTVQARLLPEQAPPHALRLQPCAGFAFSVTAVFGKIGVSAGAGTVDEAVGAGNACRCR